MEKIKILLKTSFLKTFTRKNIDKNSWIFSSVDNKYFNYNSKYLFEYIRDNHKEIHPKFVINDDALRAKLQAEYGKEYFMETKSKEGIKEALNAGVWFTSAGLPVYGRKLKKGRLIVNLWHGVPLKKITLMENQASRLYKWYFKFIFSDNYDCILTTSKSLVPIMQQSFAVKESVIKVWGQPRNDVIFNHVNRDRFLTEAYGNTIAPFDKVLLYAPTYREESKTRLFPFDDFSEEELVEFLKKNRILLLIRTHISECGNMTIKECENIKYMNSDVIEDITEFLSAIDMVITDYSSLYIDYLLTQRPVLFLPYDKDTYFINRGFNFDYDEVTPGPKPETFKGFQAEVLKLLGDSSYYKEERQKINHFFNEVNEPCSERIYQEVQKMIVQERI